MHWIKSAKLLGVPIFAFMFMVSVIPIVSVESTSSDRILLQPGNYPDYSSNRERIAYTSGDYRKLQVMNSDGSDPTLLIEERSVGWPDWSPDDSKIVYAARVIKVIDVETGENEIVVEEGSNQTPRWSHNGSKILFNHLDASVPGGYWNFYTYDVESGEICKLTTVPHYYHIAYPDWGPDDLKIVYAYAESHDENHDIYVMNCDPSDFPGTRVVENGNQPKFFPDGRRILFRRENNLFSVEIDGTNVIQLTECPPDMKLEHGDVSPDGEEIAFAAGEGYGSWNIYKMSLPPVVSWEHVFEDPYRGTFLKISTNDKHFQFITPEKTFPTKHDPNMMVQNHIMTINFEDHEIRLHALAINDRWDFCIAYASDLETGKQYLLIDPPNY